MPTAALQKRREIHTTSVNIVGVAQWVWLSLVTVISVYGDGHEVVENISHSREWQLRRRRRRDGSVLHL